MRAVRVKETTHTERLHYLDWLRVIAVLGVFYAHTTNIYDQLYWHVRGGDQNAGLIVLVVFGTQWGMALFWSSICGGMASQHPRRSRWVT